GTNGWASGDYLTFEQPGPGPGGPGGPGGNVGGTLVWPVSGGTWEIIQGYNGGTHNNRSATAQYYYALDIARRDGATAGTSVYAPASGTVVWNDPNSGGIMINMGNGYAIAMFHCTFMSSLQRGSQITQGQYLGFI